MGTFLRIYIDFDHCNWVKLLLITELDMSNKNAFSTKANPFFFTHGYHAKFLKIDENRMQLEMKSGILN